MENFVRPEMISVMIDGIFQQVNDGVSKERLKELWIPFALAKEAQKTENAGLKTENPLKTEEAEKPTRKRGVPSRPKAANNQTYADVVEGMTPVQLTEELYKLTSKFSYSSLGKALQLNSAGAYSTLRSWCTGDYLPTEKNLQQIKTVLIDVANKKKETLEMLTPPGERPKGGF